MLPWHTFNPATPHAKAFNYVRHQFLDGEHRRSDTMTVYTMSRLDFLALIERWNCLGKRGNVSNLTYIYNPTNA